MKLKPCTKKLTVLALISFLSAGALFAGGWGHKDPSKHMEKMSKKLNLSEQQQTEMKKIMEEFRIQQEELHKQHKERILVLLDDEQKAKFNEMHSKKDREHRKKHTEKE